MATIEELMRGNLLDVFNERDDERRHAAIVRIYRSDVQFSDPDETVTGHGALDAKAQRILAEAPGFVFAPVGPVLVAQDLGYLEWQFGPQDAAPVVRGVDVAHIRDGLIASVYTLLLAD